MNIRFIQVSPDQIPPGERGMITHENLEGVEVPVLAHDHAGRFVHFSERPELLEWLAKNKTRPACPPAFQLPDHTYKALLQPDDLLLTISLDECFRLCRK